jgi:hypothetical protein
VLQDGIREILPGAIVNAAIFMQNIDSYRKTRKSSQRLAEQSWKCAMNIQKGWSVLIDGSF